MLLHFGTDIKISQAGRTRVIQLTGQPELRGKNVDVPGDPSSAAFPLVAALLVPGSRVTTRIEGIGELHNVCISEDLTTSKSPARAVTTN